MFKFAVALAVVYEWLAGPAVQSVRGLGLLTLHTVCATLLAWMILEGWRTLYLGAMSLDDTRR
jgi:hypothetical protein